MLMESRALAEIDELVSFTPGDLIKIYEEEEERYNNELYDYWFCGGIK